MDIVSIELGKQRDQFRISIESKVDNPLGTISFNKQFHLGKKNGRRSNGDGTRKLEIPCSIW